jgi:hypothetical protein
MSSKTTRKNLKQIAALVVAVVVVIVVSLVFQNWWKSRPGPEPAEVAITASNGTQTIEVLPYSICEPGVECTESEVPTISAQPGDTINLQLPSEIYDHDWSLLTIYDDPVANDEFYYGPYEQKTADVTVTADAKGESTTKPKLVVLEIKAVMIGHDSNGVETPYTTTWSLSVSQ